VNLFVLTSYLPVMTLRNGETRWLSTANGSNLIYATTLEAIFAATGLQRLEVARRRCRFLDETTAEMKDFAACVGLRHVTERSRANCNISNFS
jgi:hypothetical protein